MDRKASLVSTSEACYASGSTHRRTCLKQRLHWIAGPYGTWKGGREKAPAAFCRKVLTSPEEIEMWGDGLQTRSFTFIDDCVEGILRITKSDFKEVRDLPSRLPFGSRHCRSHIGDICLLSPQPAGRSATCRSMWTGYRAGS